MNLHEEETSNIIKLNQLTKPLPQDLEVEELIHSDDTWEELEDEQEFIEAKLYPKSCQGLSSQGILDLLIDIEKRKRYYLDDIESYIGDK